MHLAQWFDVETECPSGCGCNCVTAAITASTIVEASTGSADIMLPPPSSSPAMFVVAPAYITEYVPGHNDHHSPVVKPQTISVRSPPRPPAASTSTCARMYCKCCACVLFDGNVGMCCHICVGALCWYCCDVACCLCPLRCIHNLPSVPV